MKFYKVTENVLRDRVTGKVLPEDTDVSKLIDEIILPSRATLRSAGYDIFALHDVIINPGEVRVLSTGIKIELPDGYYLAINSKSGLSYRYPIKNDDTVSIIDADYYDTGMDILVKLRNLSTDKPLHIKKGQAFCQGVICKYYITDDDSENNRAITRTGGFGSTSK